MNVKYDKLKAALLGLAVALVTLELALRITGGIYARKSSEDNRSNRPGYYTVLCLGDSYTFGAGALSGQSYPKQLEAILNARIKHPAYAVINRGQDAQSTYSLLQYLPQNLEQVKPDMVILLSGSANILNYHDLLCRTYAATGNPGLKPLIWLSDLRAYKLCRMLYFRINSHPFDNPVLVNKIRAWVREDMDQIIQICLAHNLKVILLNYPVTENEAYSKFHKLFKILAFKYSIPLIDNATVFNRLPNLNAYVSEDKHCNAKGYRLMAETLYPMVAALSAETGAGNVRHSVTQ